MGDVIGKYKTKEKMVMRLGISAFTLPEGSSVRISQVDNECRKVMFHCSGACDWVSDSILNKLERIA